MNFGIVKKGQIVIAVLIFLVCGLFVATINLFHETANDLKANAVDDSWSFSKIQANVKINEGNIDEINNETFLDYIEDNDFVLLDNTTARNHILSKTSGTTSTEGIYIEFGVDTPMKFIDIKATLNGRGIILNEINETSQGYSFNQTILGLPNEIRYSDTKSLISDPEGEYVFNYIYHAKKEDGTAGERVEGKFSFRLITKANYDETIVGEEKVSAKNLFNTYEIDKSNIKPSTTETANHFFNYNNFNTSTTPTNTLQFPTIKYDATKYNLSFTKKLQNATVETTSSLELFLDNSAFLHFFSKSGGQTDEFVIEIQNIKTNPMVEITFEDIGEYTFNFNYIVVVDKKSYVENNNLEPITKTLKIFGYQLKYAEKLNGSEELVDAEKDLFADISLLNEEYLKGTSNNIVFNATHSEDLYKYIPKTNQAPLWFDFLGTLSTSDGANRSVVYYIKNTATLEKTLKSSPDQNQALNDILKDSSKTTKYNYTKNQFFSNAGLYIVEIKYNVNNDDKLGNLTFSQIFAFEITNTPPVVTMYVNNGQTYEPIQNNTYTNKDVVVNWQISSPFNAEISATYTLTDYKYNIISQNVELLVSNTETKSIGTILSQNGIYTLKIYYGNSKYTYSTYTFTIDKNPISNIKYLLENGKTDITKAISTLPITNENFQITFDEKESGATITAEYQTILIVQDTNYIKNLKENAVKFGQQIGEIAEKCAILNGWTTSDVSSVLSFEKNTVFSTQAIYLIRLTDSAGNQAFTHIILDKTNPVMLFDPAIDNTYNILDKDTTVTIGSHKGLNVHFDFNNIILKPSEADTPEKLFEHDLFAFDDDGNIKMMTVELDTKTYNLDTPASVALRNENPQTIEEFSFDATIEDPTTKSSLDGYFYYIVIADKSIIKTRLGEEYFEPKSGKCSTLLEVNLDKSRLIALSENPLDTSSAGEGKRLYDSSATNRDLLYLNFNKENGGYVVESLTYTFYPLTLDTNSSLYPYASEPTIIDEDLLSSITLQSKDLTYNTAYINPIIATVKEIGKTSTITKQVTKEGLYVITRTYEDNGLFPDESSRTKQYYFMVDRISPIDKIASTTASEEMITVGDYIKIFMGLDEEGSYNTYFTNFHLKAQGTNKILFSTDVLPIKPIIPYNKYYTETENLTNSIASLLGSFYLEVKVYYTSPEGVEDEPKIFNTLDGSYIQFDSKCFRKIGKYRFVINDKSGYYEFDESGQLKGENLSPNTFEFSFEITKEFPQADYYGTPNEDGTDKLIQSNTSSSTTLVIPSTNDKDLKLVFTEPVDSYKARIDVADIQVTRKPKNTTQFETPITVQFFDANDPSVEFKSSTEMTSLSEIIGKREVVVTSSGQETYKYTVVLPTQTLSGELYEGEYKFSLHYYGDKEDYWNNEYYEQGKETKDTLNYYTNRDSQLRVVLDHTAPNFNLIRLINADRYLPESSQSGDVISKSDLISYAKDLIVDANKKEQIRQFLRTYTFAISDDFVFRRATNDGFPTSQNFDLYDYAEHDTNQIYYRYYPKYEQKIDSDQSYIISDPEYKSTNKPKFEKANPVYKQYSYSTSDLDESFVQYVSSLSGDGYYELIEIDQAGNQTIYTVYVNTKQTQATFTHKIEETEQIICSKENPIISVSYDYILSKIENIDPWTTIQVSDMTSQSTKVVGKFAIIEDISTPELITLDFIKASIENIVQQINELIVYKSEYAHSGAKYQIYILDRKEALSADDIVLYIQQPGDELELTIDEGTVSFTVTLPLNTQSTWATQFDVYQINTTDPNPDKRIVKLEQDSKGKAINVTEVDTPFTFNPGEYVFYYVDNFGRGLTNPIHYIFGIQDIKDFVFSDVYIQEGDTYTTSHITGFAFQERLYKLSVLKNGEECDWEHDEDISVHSITSDKTTSGKITYLEFSTPQNALVSYTIIVTPIISALTANTFEIDDIIYTLNIDTRLPNFELTDKNGNNLNFLLNNSDSSTAKEVFVNWTEEQGFPVIVNAICNDGKTSWKTTLNRGDSLFLEGTYTLTMTTTLNLTASWTFSISQLSAILYDVYSNGKVLEPALLAQEFSIYEVYQEQIIDIKEKMKLYVSIYDFTVTANEQRDLQARKCFEYTSPFEDYTLQIYLIFGQTSIYYQEYIALLKLNSKYLELQDLKVGTSPTELNIPASASVQYYNSNGYLQYTTNLTKTIAYATSEVLIPNFYYVDLYYNDQFVNAYNQSLFEFTNNGNYKLIFKDIAGKIYSFANNTSTINYFSIELINNVSFLINDEEPIENAIFNSKVELKTIKTSNYTPNTFTMQVKLNGTQKESKIYKTTNGWTFSDYGFWELEMKVQINGIEVGTQYSFTILSKDEARQNYSFGSLTNYEIIEVTKDTPENSILEELKAKQGVSNLYDLYLSTDNNDYGRYTITVQVTNNDFKPTQFFTYEIWLNRYEPNVTASIDFGGQTTNPITIQLNKYAIYNQLGNFQIRITGMTPIDVNKDTVGDNVVSSIKLTANRTYFIELWSESGNMIASYKVTKLEPLNTVAIIIIVVSSLVVVLLIFFFIRLRTKMKVR